MSELKPCPFCGGEADVLEFYDVEPDDVNFGGSCICCRQCGANSPVHFDRKENLYASWNDRIELRCSADSAQPVASGRYEFPYNRTFQAIAAATSVYAKGVGVNVSVDKFQEAFNSHADARPLTEPQTAPIGYVSQATLRLLSERGQAGHICPVPAYDTLIPVYAGPVQRCQAVSVESKVCGYHDGCPPDGPVCHLCQHLQPRGSALTRPLRQEQEG